MFETLETQAVGAIICTIAVMVGFCTRPNFESFGFMFIVLAFVGLGVVGRAIGGMFGVAVMLFMAMSMSVILLYK